MRDLEKLADTEGEVQMGTTRADGRRRLDAETWDKVLRLLRDGVLSIVVAVRKVYRETHKRNVRPHQQVEQAQTGECNRRNVVGCSHTIKFDEASGSDP